MCWMFCARSRVFGRWTAAPWYCRMRTSSFAINLRAIFCVRPRRWRWFWRTLASWSGGRWRQVQRWEWTFPGRNGKRSMFFSTSYHDSSFTAMCRLIYWLHRLGFQFIFTQENNWRSCCRAPLSVHFQRNLLRPITVFGSKEVQKSIRLRWTKKLGKKTKFESALFVKRLPQVAWFIDRSIDRLIFLLFGWLIDWLIDLCIVWLVDWLIDCWEVLLMKIPSTVAIDWLIVLIETRMKREFSCVYSVQKSRVCYTHLLLLKDFMEKDNRSLSQNLKKEFRQVKLLMQSLDNWQLFSFVNRPLSGRFFSCFFAIFWNLSRLYHVCSTRTGPRTL